MSAILNSNYDSSALLTCKPGSLRLADNARYQIDFDSCHDESVEICHSLEKVTIFGVNGAQPIGEATRTCKNVLKIVTILGNELIFFMRENSQRRLFFQIDGSSFQQTEKHIFYHIQKRLI